MDWFWEHEIPLAPPTEQDRIVEILDEADQLRNLRREADEKAARILPVLFLKMFGDPVTNPKGLRKEPLGKLIKVKSGEFLPAKDMVDGGMFPVYGGNGINGYHNKFLFDKPKIVLGRVGAYCGAIHYSEPRAWITDNALYVSEKLENLNDHYLVSALKVANLNQYAGRAGQPLISGSRIYPVEILVPLEREQVTFARFVERLLDLDKERTGSGDKLDHLWTLLMQRAFSGQLTAKWRQARMKELLAEMNEQAKLLNLPLPNELESQP
jgi:type I restriction enzyme S subunit